MNIIKSKKKSSKKKYNHQKIKKEPKLKPNNKESENPVNEDPENPVSQDPEPFILDSKNECMKLILDSIEKYIKENNIDYDEKSSQYKIWLELFSKDDYLNEYENQESGIFYNTVYHHIWDSFFEYNNFIIL